MNETDGDRLARLGTDGDAWAREFVSAAGRGDFAALDASGRVDVMRTWFANAIEAGASREAGRRHRAEELARWLVRLDDPADADARAERREITLTRIIARAQEALDQEEAHHGRA